MMTRAGVIVGGATYLVGLALPTRRESVFFRIGRRHLPVVGACG